MPFDAMELFKAGSQLGEAQAGPASYATQNIMDMFKQREMMKSMYAWNPEMQLARAKIGMINKMGGAGENISGAPSGASDKPDANGLYAEDYYNKPVMKDVFGVPMQMNEKAIKEMVPHEALTHLAEVRNGAQNLMNTVNLMSPGVKRFMNPLDPLTQRAGLGSKALQVIASGNNKDANDAREFINFKAETDKNFSSYRRAIEGARAAYGEWQWVEPDYPQPSEAPSAYLMKAIQGVHRSIQSEQNTLDTASQAGYRTGALRHGSLINDQNYQQFIQKYGQSAATSIGNDKNNEDALMAKALANHPKQEEQAFLLNEYKRRNQGREYGVKR